jgi:O-methyltransferase
MNFMKHISEAEIRRYVIDVGTRQTKVQRRLREQTLEMTQGNMACTPPAGQLLALLAKTVNAKRAIEIGTFTGYSALAIAGALPEDGELVACDNDPETVRHRQRKE